MNVLVSENTPMRIPLRNFINYTESLEQSESSADLFEKDFQSLKVKTDDLKKDSSYSCSNGEKDCNRKKNRYKDILPYDCTRVLLKERKHVPGSDYINANYIKGATGSKAYIAAQGPLANTLDDFWRMVWEHDVQVIVMASAEYEGGKHKCEKYWAEEDDTIICGNFEINGMNTNNVCSDFVIRTLKVMNKGSLTEPARNVVQFHYSTWPDHGAPDSADSLIAMVRMIRESQVSETLPVVVHCSAGCGRTGTICVIDYVWGLIRSGKLNSSFSLVNLIGEMRKQRIAMVQTKEQYVLLHTVIKDMFQKHLDIVDAHPYENVAFINNHRPHCSSDDDKNDYESVEEADDRPTKRNSKTDENEPLGNPVLILKLPEKHSSNSGHSRSSSLVETTNDNSSDKFAFKNIFSIPERRKFNSTSSRTKHSKPSLVKLKSFFENSDKAIVRNLFPTSPRTGRKNSAENELDEGEDNLEHLNEATKHINDVSQRYQDISRLIFMENAGVQVALSKSTSGQSFGAASASSFSSVEMTSENQVLPDNDESKDIKGETSESRISVQRSKSLKTVGELIRISSPFTSRKKSKQEPVKMKEKHKENVSVAVAPKPAERKRRSRNHHDKDYVNLAELEQEKQWLEKCGKGRTNSIYANLDSTSEKDRNYVNWPNTNESFENILRSAQLQEPVRNPVSKNGLDESCERLIQNCQEYLVASADGDAGSSNAALQELLELEKFLNCQRQSTVSKWSSDKKSDIVRRVDNCNIRDYEVIWPTATNLDEEFLQTKLLFGNSVGSSYSSTTSTGSSSAAGKDRSRNSSSSNNTKQNAYADSHHPNSQNILVNMNPAPKHSFVLNSLPKPQRCHLRDSGEVLSPDTISRNNELLERCAKQDNKSFQATVTELKALITELEGDIGQKQPFNRNLSIYENVPKIMVVSAPTRSDYVNCDSINREGLSAFELVKSKSEGDIIRLKKSPTHTRNVVLVKNENELSPPHYVEYRKSTSDEENPDSKFLAEKVGFKPIQDSSEAVSHNGDSKRIKRERHNKHLNCAAVEPAFRKLKSSSCNRDYENIKFRTYPGEQYAQTFNSNVANIGQEFGEDEISSPSITLKAGNTENCSFDSSSQSSMTNDVSRSEMNSYNVTDGSNLTRAFGKLQSNIMMKLGIRTDNCDKQELQAVTQKYGESPREYYFPNRVPTKPKTPRELIFYKDASTRTGFVS